MRCTQQRQLADTDQRVEHRNICGVVEADRDLSAGTRSQVVDVFDSDDSAVADDRDGVAQVVDLVEDMRREEHGATFGDDFVHEPVELSCTSGSSPEVGSSSMRSSGR